MARPTAGEYLAEVNPDRLAAIAGDFARFAPTSQTHFDVLHRLAETAGDEADADRLETVFDAWVSEANDEEQLFDTRQDMLE